MTIMTNSNPTIKITGRILADDIAPLAKALSVGLEKFGVPDGDILIAMKKCVQDGGAFIISLNNEEYEGFTYVVDHDLLKACHKAKVVFALIDNGEDGDPPYKMQVQLDNFMLVDIIEAKDGNISVPVSSLPAPKDYAEWSQAMLRMQVHNKLTLMPAPALRPKP